jgi:hypothetical protein
MLLYNEELIIKHLHCKKKMDAKTSKKYIFKSKQILVPMLKKKLAETKLLSKQMKHIYMHKDITIYDAIHLDNKVYVHLSDSFV